MGIVDLITRIGNENIKVQFLDQCATQLNYSGKGQAKITFGTDQPLDLRGTEDMGIVVWVPRAEVDRLLGEK